MTKQFESQGDLIRDRMQRLGMTQYALAKAMGLDKAYFGKIVNNKKREIGHARYHVANPEQIDKLASILRINPDDLWITAGKVPPDVIRILLDHPELLSAVRQAGKIRAEAKEKTNV